VESRVELFAAIRRDRRVEDLSIRDLAEKHYVRRRTVPQALAAATPPPRKVLADRARAGAVQAGDRWDAAGGSGGAAQAASYGPACVGRLVEEHAAEGLVVFDGPGLFGSATTRDLGGDRPHRQPGVRAQDRAFSAEGEVDFADLWVVLGGVKTKTHLFTFRLSGSGRSVHRAFSTQGQEAFLEGHVYAFEQLGGVPFSHVRYDNLKAAVSQVLTGRNRLESDR
jgi:hypothetical protein